MTPELQDRLLTAPGVLFLCSGNVVRSAFAELYARHRGFPVPVASAATTYRNPRLFPETVAALGQLGVSDDLLRAFRPRHLADVLPSLEPGTLVLGMTRAHLVDLEDLGGAAFPARLLHEALGAPRDIDDPVMDAVEFGATYRTVARCVDALADAGG